jgi:guanine deaminase
MVVGGKTCMDRNAPTGCATSAYDDSKALLEKWHGRDRITYAITPRFTVVARAATLWAEHPDCLMQMHSEQIGEIAWVAVICAGRDYLDTYKRLICWVNAGCMAILSTWNREIDRLAAEINAAVVHCPTLTPLSGPVCLTWLAWQRQWRSWLVFGASRSL